MLGALFLLVSVHAAAQAQTLLVMPLQSQGVAGDAVSRLHVELLSVAARIEGFRVLAPDEIAALVEHETQKQIMGCAEEHSCLAALGDQAGADLVLSGNIGAVGDTLVLSLTAMSPKQGQVVGRGTATAPSTEALLPELEGALGQALGLTEVSKKTAFTLQLPKGGVKAAVMPMTTQSIEDDVGKSITQLVALELKGIEGFSVISQDDIAAMLSLEAGKQQLGCDDASCFAEIGGALGVDYLVTGSVGRLEDTFLVSLKLIDTKGARVLNRVHESFKGRQSDLIAAARFAVYQLVGYAPSGAGALAIKANPDDAVIVLNGESLVTGASSLGQLQPGRHSLRLDAEGYYSHYLETYVQPGATNQVLIELTPIPRAWYERWWVWTLAGVIVAGAAGTVVLLGDDGGKAKPDTGSIALEVSRALHLGR